MATVSVSPSAPSSLASPSPSAGAGAKAGAGHPLALNLLQLTKAGLHLGGPRRLLNGEARPLLRGQTAGHCLVDLGPTLVASRRLLWLLRKLGPAGSSVFCPDLALGPRGLGYRGRNRNGLLTNLQFYRARRQKPLPPPYLAARPFLVREPGRRGRPPAVGGPAGRAETGRRRGPTLPCLALFGRPAANLHSLRDSRRKGLLSALLADSSCSPRLSHYPLLANNRAPAGLHYLGRLLRLAGF